MSEVFFSYKREDEVKAARIARALIAAGFDVWWDRGLPGGENWRANIETELHGARCCVVLWSKASVAQAGHFVRDEAGHAQARNRLIPVFIDKVAPPLGFGELQGIDLIHWRGDPRDAFFQDLIAAIRAKLDNTSVPRAKGPTVRAWRRARTSGGLATAACIVAALAFNPAGVVTKACTVCGEATFLSDACGTLHIGGQPSHGERRLWQARRPGSCEDLRNYIDRYHDGGAYVNEAQALLAARHRKERFVPGTRQLPLYVMGAETAASGETASRAKALSVGAARAERSCRGFAATTLFQFVSAEVDARQWHCEKTGVSVMCRLEGMSICHLQERREQDWCGGNKV